MCYTIIKFPNDAEKTPLLMTDLKFVYEEIPEEKVPATLRGKRGGAAVVMDDYLRCWTYGPLLGKYFKKIGKVPTFKRAGETSFSQIKNLTFMKPREAVIPALIRLLNEGAMEMKDAAGKRFGTTANLATILTETGEFKTILTLHIDKHFWGNCDVTVENEAWHHRLTEEELYHFNLAHETKLNIVMEASLEPSQNIALLASLFQMNGIETALPRVMEHKIAPLHLKRSGVYLTINELEQLFSAFNCTLKAASYEKSQTEQAKKHVQTFDAHYDETTHLQLNAVLTLAEATKAWGLADGTLRKAIQSAKFQEGVDYRKSGNTWLITRRAMRNHYGER